MLKPTLVNKTSLQQSLTPQQIHYLKLLQLPVLQLEQSIRQEIESNPFLEEDKDENNDDFAEHDIYAPAPDQQDNNADEDLGSGASSDDENLSSTFYDNNTTETIYTEDLKNTNIEAGDSYDYYANLWEDDDTFTPNKTNDFDNDFEPFQIKSENSFYEDLILQQNLLNLSPEENILCLHIIGSIDDDGYLRRDLNDIVDETNEIIREHNFNIQKEEYERKLKNNEDEDANPAASYSLDSQSIDVLQSAVNLSGPNTLTSAPLFFAPSSTAPAIAAVLPVPLQ